MGAHQSFFWVKHCTEEALNFKKEFNLKSMRPKKQIFLQYLLSKKYINISVSMDKRARDYVHTKSKWASNNVSARWRENDDVSRDNWDKNGESGNKASADKAGQGWSYGQSWAFLVFLCRKLIRPSLLEHFVDSKTQDMSPPNKG